MRHFRRVQLLRENLTRWDSFRRLAARCHRHGNYEQSVWSQLKVFSDDEHERHDYRSEVVHWKLCVTCDSDRVLRQ